MSRHDHEDALTSAALLVALVVAVFAALTTFVILMVAEIGKIYASRAWGQSTQVARLLWLALIAEVGVLAVGVLLMTDGATWPYGASLNAWSFLVFVIVIECCDRYQDRLDHTTAELRALGGLEQHLGPQEILTSVRPSTNGRTTVGAIQG